MIKEADGVITVFHYDNYGKLIAESLADGTIAAEYLYMGKIRMAKVDVATGAIYYYLNDRLGTPQILTDDTGKVVWEAEYKPFGEADVNPNSEVVNNIRLPGQYYDAKTRLHYNYHRYYDPAIGRYLRTDPIGLAGGINPFLYSWANPINFIDLYGLEFSDIFPGIKKAIVEGAKGGTYAVGEATKATADIAMHGHPLAQTALGIAFVSEAAPLTAAAAIAATHSTVSAAYIVGPYSGAIVDVTYGLFAETGMPRGWGYLSSGGMFAYQKLKEYFTNMNSSPCEDK